ncbi:hypothetical protein [Sphingobacterium pedocola]|uniref:O-antigen polysaccharide polymerase Wzy n=1 Tax=Sphingobacterium pedocola TaxID=2082722 RepID=A0ABR9T1V7_9SPHI|nr:hypothetical protein [Sphingobacterium pedocola]MBE8719327.1 hypothetical protein [Sphingobacterium pedocola]
MRNSEALRARVSPLKNTYKEDKLSGIKKIVDVILYVAVFFEVLFFPEIGNLIGCVMTLFCWWIFRYFFLFKKIILLHPFSFLMFLSMFMYRFVPFIATLVEGKPITYGFENAYETFFYETLLFVVSALAFYFASVQVVKPASNFVQEKLCKLNFYKSDIVVLWVMGFIGLIAQLYSLMIGGRSEYGDVLSKSIAGIQYMIYAPSILLFPSLTSQRYTVNRAHVLIYLGVVFTLSLATNSRQTMLMPVATLTLLFCLDILRRNLSIRQFVSPMKLAGFVVFFVFGMSLISDISIAMLANRGIRAHVSREELFIQTWNTLQNREQMDQLRKISSQYEIITNESYMINGWTETYIDNFMLNRYGNMRISDQTIYYANVVGWENLKMRDDLITKIWAILPTPILNNLGVKINKEDLEYSRGDYLYNLATGSGGLGGYRVTSHIGDGLATWGMWYFPIQFVIFYLVFKLLDCFVLYTKRGFIYSPYGLMSIFLFLGMFRNANGHFQDISYLMRGFWQDCFTYLVVYWLIKTLTKSLVNR